MVNNLLVHFYFSNFWVFHSNLLIIILRQAPHILHPSSMIFTYLQFRTPHIDSLFASSLTLPSFYTSSPVCIRIALFAAYKEQVKTKGVLTLSCLLPYWITCCHQVEQYTHIRNSGVSYPSRYGPQSPILDFAAASIPECSPLETLEDFLPMFQLCPLYWGRGTTPPCFLVICTIC